MGVGAMPNDDSEEGISLRLMPSKACMMPSGFSRLRRKPRLMVKGAHTQRAALAHDVEAKMRNQLALTRAEVNNGSGANAKNGTANF